MAGFSSTTLDTLRGQGRALADRAARFVQGALDVAGKPLNVNMDPRLSTYDPQAFEKARAERDGEVRAFRQAQLEQVRTERAGLDAQRRTVLNQVEAALGRPALADTQQALLRETREARSWQRTKGLLDRVELSAGAMQQAVEPMVVQAAGAGDDDTIHALRTELAHYLRGRGLDEVTASFVRDGVDATLARVRPELADALAVRGELKTGMARLDVAYSQLQDMLQRGDSTAVVPDWNKGVVWKVNGTEVTKAGDR